MSGAGEKKKLLTKEMDLISPLLAGEHVHARKTQESPGLGARTHTKQLSLSYPG